MLVPLAFLLVLSVGPAAGEPPQAPATPGKAQAAPEDFDAELRRHAYFQKIVWTTDRSFAPYEILVQTQAVPEPWYEQKVAQFYGPWLQRMAQQFDEQLATPAGLPPGTKPLPIRLIVLVSEGDYLNYAKTVKTLDNKGSNECYDDRLRAVVTAWNPGGPDHLRRYFVLRHFGYALLHQRSTGFGGRQPPLWLRDGISSALAWHIAPDPATAFAKPLIASDLLSALVKISQDPSQQNLFLLPLSELASVVSIEDLWKRVKARSGAAENRQELALIGYVSQCCLWVHFLRREGAPAHNAAFAEYLRAAMRGGGSPADLKRAFEGIDLVALDQEFFRWCYARYVEGGKPKPDEARLLTLFGGPGAAAAPGVPAPASNLAGLARRLAPPSNDADASVGLACRRAARGDVEGALADLAKALASEPDAVTAARLRTEVARLEGWRSARDAWLTDLVATGGRFQLERDGKKIPVKPKRIEEGKLFYDAGKNEQSLAITGLDPVQLAAQMKAAPAGTPAWARAYAMLLGGDERWDKLLKDKAPDSLALRADAAGDYARIRLAGMAAAHLQALAERAELPDSKAAAAVLERARTMLLEVPNHPLVAERLAAVRELVLAAARRFYDAEKPPAEFQAKATWIDAEEVELVYDFDSPGEADDWLDRPDQFVAFRGGYPPLTESDALRGMQVADGVWHARGSHVRRHFLHFESPMTVRIEHRHGSAQSEFAGLGALYLGICAEAESSYVGTTEDGAIFLKDAATGKFGEVQERQPYNTLTGDLVTIELVHDGKHVRFAPSGKDVPAIDASMRRSGEVFLVLHGDREIAIQSIKIRGRIGAEGKRRLRERWIAAKVKAVGL